MDKILQYFIDEKGETKVVANVLAKTIKKYSDIEEEFLYWLNNRNFNTANPLIILGYSAKDIHEIEPSLDAAGIYNFMVTLRDNPEKAEFYIKNGFPKK